MTTTTTTINTQLVKYSTDDDYFTHCLPDHLLYSDDFYVTERGFYTLQEFSDDQEVQELFDKNQLSDRLMESIDLKIDELFKRDLCPDIFSSEALNELRLSIKQKLETLDLSEAIIY